MAVDNMVLVHSSVALVDMDHNKNRDRSSSLTKREPKLPKTENLKFFFHTNTPVNFRV